MYSSDLHFRISQYLPDFWFAVTEEKHLSVLLLSRDVEKTTQRRVSFFDDGSVDVSVHRSKLCNEVLEEIFSKVRLMPWSSMSINDFVSNVVRVVNEVRKYEVCVGCDKTVYQCFWNSGVNGRVDLNPYGESRYSQTFRSNDCQLLISPSKFRCKSCYKLCQLLRRRLRTRQSGMKLHAPNMHLTETEKIKKIESITKQLHAKNKVILKLQQKVQVSSHAAH